MTGFGGTAVRMLTRLGAVAALALGVCFVSPGQPGQERKNAGILIFDLSGHGVSPSAITVKTGWYLFTVRNGVSLSQLDVKVDHENLTNVLRDTIKAASAGTQRLILLQPGKHTLTVGTRAEWTATIVVTQ